MASNLINVEFVRTRLGSEFTNYLECAVELGTVEGDGKFYPIVRVEAKETVTLNLFSSGRDRWRSRRIEIGL